MIRSVALGKVAVAASLVGLLVVGGLGCGGNPNRPPLAKVNGSLTYKGKPLAKANISFLPETKGIVSGLGVTDENGHYALSTYESNDGAPVGKHRVAISLRGPPEKVKPNMGDAYYEEMEGVGKPLIPQKYFDPAKSGLTADVQAGKTNVFDFELND